ncbi:hypothetical protein AB0C90_00070 [Streptomyces sp. NPDC048550]|uniref:hypothetical protein n=1 Tax=Streptomyces sp. NPDC048550 TaxID=3155739 RepID=UPI00342A38D7
MTHEVWVTGDQTIDWAVTPSEKYGTRNIDERLHIDITPRWHMGGIFLLRDLIDSALNGGARGTGHVHSISPPNDPEPLAIKNKYNHSFAVLEEYHPSESKKPVHRMSQFLGFHRADHAGLEYIKPERGGHPEVIVIDDANLGFRRASGNWKGIIPGVRAKYHPWVLLKMSHEIVDGDLWGEIGSRLDNRNDWLWSRLVVVTSVARMRDAGAEVSRDLSWDRSVNDILAEIATCKKLEGLKKLRCLIVSFGPSGALLIKRVKAEHLEWTLVCDHESMEGEWASRHNRDGMMFGYGSILCACLTRTLCGNGATSRSGNSDYSSFDNPALAKSVKAGLVAMNLLYEKGFQLDSEQRFSFPMEIFKGIDDSAQSAQFSIVCRHQKIAQPGKARAEIEETLTPPNGSLNAGSALLDIARLGKGRLLTSKLLADVPVAKYGDLITVDQVEIESLHTIHNLIDTYLANYTLKSNPLAVAVFGKPGSGKGYTIKQLVKSWAEEERVETLDFNLSQFNSASELVGALHKVRDVALSGRIPVTIWDEFDVPLNAAELGWLKYFLAPIQDGKFQQGDITHLIGPSIFVFAGGASETFSQFKEQAESLKTDSKARDFVSRMRGYIDIPGINSPDGSDLDSKLMLRRALILNSLFIKHGINEGDNGFSVDDGIVHAFLAIPEYNHGVRSMDAIVQMSRLRKTERYARSTLPSQEQLGIHVDGVKFLGIVRTHDGEDRR